jgi:hypothetical protein
MLVLTVPGMKLVTMWTLAILAQLVLIVTRLRRLIASQVSIVINPDLQNGINSAHWVLSPLTLALIVFSALSALEVTPVIREVSPVILLPLQPTTTNVRRVTSV